MGTGNSVTHRYESWVGFRFANELLASQKEFALKVVELMTPTKAA